MKYRLMGKTGLKVSVLAFGCNQIGSPDYGYRDDKNAEEAISIAIDLGINLFDTADVYGGRRSESLLGRALAGRRRDVIISTKAGLTGDGGRNGRPGYLRTALENSLRDLKTDYVDIFFLHEKDPAVPIGESLEAVNKLIKEGKARFGGITNTTMEQLGEIAPDSISVVQNRLNIFERESIEDIIPFCRKNEIGFSVYSPLASGLLGGGRFAAPLKKPVILDYRFWNPDFPYLLEFKDVANSAGVNPAQLALAWSLGQEGVATVIMGTSSISQLQDNMRSLDLELSRESLREIDDIVFRRSKAHHPVRKMIWKTAGRVKGALAQK